MTARIEKVTTAITTAETEALEVSTRGNNSVLLWIKNTLAVNALTELKIYWKGEAGTYEEVTDRQVNGAKYTVLQTLAASTGAHILIAIPGSVALKVTAKSTTTTLEVAGVMFPEVVGADTSLDDLLIELEAIKTAVQIIDDWDESDRAAVNTIAGQVGVAADTGVIDALTQRMTIATDDTVATDLTAIKNATEIMDDWDESDRCKSNPIVGQAGVAADAGVIDALTQRVTIATDDTLVTDLTAIKNAVEIMDDWDESDRAKVNIIVGQAGVSANSGVLDATTQRVTVATDDTVATDLTSIKTAVEIMDDWDETNRAAVNTIAGQVGVQANAGVIDALTQRVTIATDDNVSTKLTAIEADTDDLQQCIDTVNNVLDTEEQSPASIAEENNTVLSAVAGATTSSYQTPEANGKGVTLLSVMVTASGAGTVVVKVFTRNSSSQTTPNTAFTVTHVFAGAATKSFDFELPNVREYAVDITDAGGIATTSAWGSSRGNK